MNDHDGVTDAPFDAGHGARTIVVGLVPGQSDQVALAAARIAERIGDDLVCAHVDAMRYVVRKNADGSVDSRPIDPDVDDESVDDFDTELRDRLSTLFAGRSIRWSTRTLAGEPGWAIARLAETLDAEAIVVGTRYASFRAGLQEFFGGSIAVHLAHRQHRPVIVIPNTHGQHPEGTRSEGA